MKDDLREKLEERLEERFSDYYELAGGRNYRYEHSISVRDYALKIAEKIDESVDREVLEVAALFHDIGRSEDIEDGYLDPFETSEGHAERGAEILEDVIGDLVSKDVLGRVERIVGNHDSEAESVEGKVLRDADRLYKFGVQALWRTFHYASEEERSISETFEYLRNEYREDAEEIIENFNFHVTREVAEKRLQRLDETVDEIEKEMAGEDI